jgi:hypothetical protein
MDCDAMLFTITIQVDIVVVSSGGYFAFAVERRPNVGGALFAALIAILLVVLGKMLYIHMHCMRRSARGTALRCCSRQACPSKKQQPLIQSIAHFAGVTYTKLYRMDVSVYVPTPARAVLAGAIWAMNVVDFDLEDDWGGERKGVRSTDDDYYD